MAGKTKLKAGCGVALVFAGGFLCGVIALFILMVKVIPLSEGWRDEESKKFVVNHLANQLNLTEEQLVKATPIIHEALDKRYRHRKTYVEADIELTRAAFESLRPILNEDQIENAERKLKNWIAGKERFLIGGESEEKIEKGAVLKE